MVIQNCPICGKEFKAYGKLVRKYCSKPCMSQGYKEQLKGENNPNYRHGPKLCCKCNKKLNKGTQGDCCSNCIDKSGDKNPFFGKTHNDKTKEKMKNNHCDCKGSSNAFYGKSHTSQVKQVLAKCAKIRWDVADVKTKGDILVNLKKGLAKQLEMKGGTIPENKVADFLTNQNIEFKRNELLYDKFFVDFLLSNNTIIEVFGDYWHGNPECFSKLNAHQKRQINKDKSRLAYLKKCGHKVIVLWEKDINSGKINYECTTTD